VLSLVVVFAGAPDAGLLRVGSIVLRLAIFFVAALLIGRHFEWLAAWGDRLGVSQGLLATVMLTMFLYAWSADYVGGLAAITGSYMAGILFSRTSFRGRIEEAVHPLTYSLFVPAFFISFGLRIDGRSLGAHVGFTLALVLVAAVTKGLGCAAGAKALGFSDRESLQVGVGMISRGEVGLIVAGYGLSHAIIDPSVFSASIVMVLATTMVTPPLLRLAFPGAHTTSAVAVDEAVGCLPENVHDEVAGAKTVLTYRVQS
jgi:Kef-type K+ transport system membrane component KefB